MTGRLLYEKGNLSKGQLEARDLAMEDVGAFAALVLPHWMFGVEHRDLMRYMMRTDDNQLILWPRAHLKSTVMAVWAAWWIIKHPETTILYASSTATLAELQLSFIKMILDSEVVRKYWPGLIEENVNRRAKWTNSEIAVDHWKRKEEGIRDMTIKALGIGGAVTGQHYDVICLDDLVDQDNYKTESSRREVLTWFGYASSVINDNGITKAVGTRYHPKDLYNSMMKMEEEIYNEIGEVIDRKPLFTVSQRVVETDGHFLWPRQQRKDGKWFGFDWKVLASKKAKYSNYDDFLSQYYNDPTGPTAKTIKTFDYYDAEKLVFKGAHWYYAGNRLNVYAAIDFAATVTKRSDYTAIVVVGVDGFANYYVLDIDRMRTDKISEMQKALTRMYGKWHWKRLRAEATAAQNLVVEQIKDNNKTDGIHYAIEKHSPISEKRIRIATNLEPLYENQQILHRKGGLWEILEGELSVSKPAHIDLADALAAVIEIAVVPTRMVHTEMAQKPDLKFHGRFGGVV
jgi:phage terminase large subunit-like protein